MTITFSIEQLDLVAKQILEQNPSKVLLFNGEMGAGKTTLIKKLCENLGVNEPTSSPTFSLVNEYEANNNQLVYHFDFYLENMKLLFLCFNVYFLVFLILAYSFLVTV